MSYVSASLLEGATVTFKEDYGPSYGPTLCGWPFFSSPEAVVVAVALTVAHGSPSVLLVLRAPDGDLGEFFAEGARVTSENQT